MGRKTENPLVGWRLTACLLRFALSALFGTFLAMVVGGILLYAGGVWHLPRAVWYAVAALPLVWGVGGVFWFEPFIEAARRGVEDLPRRSWWWW
jgi:hypothetical protein